MSAPRFWGGRLSRTKIYVIFTKKTQKELPPLFGASFKRESQFFSTAACAFNIFVRLADLGRSASSADKIIPHFF